MSLPKRIAFVGNPNCGKSTLFNRLTGLTQKTSNLPGTTVEASTGNLQLNGEKIELVDLPGIYSLYPKSADEWIACRTLLEPTEELDLIVIVAGATKLKRSLLLVA